MARLGPRFWPRKIPPKSLCGSLFCVLSWEMRHTNFFFWGPKMGVSGGGQKVYVEKVYVLFPPLSRPGGFFSRIFFRGNSAPLMTGRRSHWRQHFFNIWRQLWPLWCACSFSGCEWAYCHGTLLCEFSIPKCGGVLGGNDQNRAEKQNVVLTWFRPVTWPSSHLGRRFWTHKSRGSTFSGKISEHFSWEIS